MSVSGLSAFRSLRCFFCPYPRNAFLQNLLYRSWTPKAQCRGKAPSLAVYALISRRRYRIPPLSPACGPAMQVTNPPCVLSRRALCICRLHGYPNGTVCPRAALHTVCRLPRPWHVLLPLRRSQALLPHVCRAGWVRPLLSHRFFLPL